MKKKSHNQVAKYLANSLKKKFADVRVEPILPEADKEIYISLSVSTTLDASDDECVEQVETLTENVLQGMGLEIETIEVLPVRTWDMVDETKLVYVSYFFTYHEQS